MVLPDAITIEGLDSVEGWVSAMVSLVLEKMKDRVKGERRIGKGRKVGIKRACLEQVGSNTMFGNGLGVKR